MKTNTLINYLLVMAAGAAVIGCSTKANTAESTPGGMSKLPVDVRVVEAMPLTQEEVVAGSILPNREVTIVSEVSRKIVAIQFDDGSHVAKGQLLYKLDDADILARLKQTEAELNLVKLNESRLAELLKNESVKQEEYDVAFSKLQSLQAAEDLLKVDLSKTTIHAPFSGFIGITKLQIGAWASAGTPLVTLQESGSLKIQFSIPEKYASSIKPGKQITFTTSLSDQKQYARISAIEPGVDPLSRNITVQAIAGNTNGSLKPGMSAKIIYSITNEGELGMALPTESLIPGANGYSVFVVKQGLARMTPVAIWNRNEAEAIISSGLNNGDTVMVSNILRTGEGTPVQMISSK